MHEWLQRARTTGARLVWTMVLVALLVPAGAVAQVPDRNGRPDLLRISLEDLLKLEVTSVAKREQKLGEAASAIFVISREDIRRSGASTIPDLLRMVPGLAVAQIDASKWAVSARGFHGRFANKMLVLVDGRSVYTPLFSGVFWDVQDTALDDIDRIEVIRGPGATLWGANAVNGVINIITRRARDTQGLALRTTVGSQEHANLTLRYGGRVGDAAYYRVYAKYFDRGAFLDAQGRESADGWNSLRAGFRVDWELSPDDHLSMQGDVYSGQTGQTYGPTSTVPLFAAPTEALTDRSGGHVLARWTRGLARRSDLAVQVYLDATSRDDLILGEDRVTGDLDFQHHLGLGRHDVVWGAGYRVSGDDVRNSSAVAFLPESRTDRLFNVFVQDEVQLFANRVRLAAGLKLEHNDYTGWELQPDSRVFVTLAPRHAVWGAASHAVRTPSRSDQDVRITSIPMPSPHGVPMVVQFQGLPTFRSETLDAFELGYRVQPSARVSIDLAGFVNRHDHLRSFDLQPPVLTLTPAGARLLAPVTFGNALQGRSRGVEGLATWDAAEWWRLIGSYSYLRVALSRRDGVPDELSTSIEDDSPRHRVHLQSRMNLSPALQLDATWSHVDDLVKRHVPSYSTLDLRFGWTPRPGLELSAGLRNALDERHVEFGSTLGETPTYGRRTAYAQALWRF